MEFFEKYNQKSYNFTKIKTQTYLGFKISAKEKILQI